ncbi:MAG: tRNA (adenosine(37)-N6)-threonylcarbamoyltransferase complex ATPase subunit type 1 TsaE [Patescibacteria group bacterium]|nr:tRNA (adenosine(37)-N6)-threonylcarbamoyltransferase complex ATPase subunit type 1 TsaE [Patescibacteria group bacterium]
MEKTQNISLAQIPKTAKQVARELKGGEILALVGPLGSGKTAFTKALGKELKAKGKIVSPTFILMNQLPARLPVSKKSVWLYHLDLYRTKNFREVKALGLKEIWGQKDAITIIEWADKIKKHLPKKSIIIKFG